MSSHIPISYANHGDESWGESYPEMDNSKGFLDGLYEEILKPIGDTIKSGWDIVIGDVDYNLSGTKINLCCPYPNLNILSVAINGEGMEDWETYQIVETFIVTYTISPLLGAMGLALPSAVIPITVAGGTVVAATAGTITTTATTTAATTTALASSGGAGALAGVGTGKAIVSGTALAGTFGGAACILKFGKNICNGIKDYGNSICAAIQWLLCEPSQKKKTLHSVHLPHNPEKRPEMKMGKIYEATMNTKPIHEDSQSQNEIKIDDRILLKGINEKIKEYTQICTKLKFKGYDLEDGSTRYNNYIKIIKYYNRPELTYEDTYTNEELDELYTLGQYIYDNIPPHILNGIENLRKDRNLFVSSFSNFKDEYKKQIKNNKKNLLEFKKRLDELESNYTNLIEKIKKYENEDGKLKIIIEDTISEIEECFKYDIKYLFEELGESIPYDKYYDNLFKKYNSMRRKMVKYSVNKYHIIKDLIDDKLEFLKCSLENPENNKDEINDEIEKTNFLKKEISKYSGKHSKNSKSFDKDYNKICDKIYTISKIKTEDDLKKLTDEIIKDINELDLRINTQLNEEKDPILEKTNWMFVCTNAKYTKNKKTHNTISFNEKQKERYHSKQFVQTSYGTNVVESIKKRQDEFENCLSALICLKDKKEDKKEDKKQKKRLGNAEIDDTEDTINHNT